MSAFLLLLSFLVLALVAADCDISDWGTCKREVQFEPDISKVVITAKNAVKNSNSTAKSELKLVFENMNKVLEGTWIDMEYKSETESRADPKIKLNFRYKYSLIGLVEFAGAAGEWYDETKAEDQFYDFGEKQSQDWQTATTSVTERGSTFNVFTFEASTTDNVFALKGKYSEEVSTNFTSVDLSPNAAKLDFEIMNFPYTAADSKLALVACLKTVDLKTETESNTDEVKTIKTRTSDYADGIVAWMNTVTLGDGSTANVLLSKPTAAFLKGNGEDRCTEAEGDMWFFTFDTDAQPNSIVWDPVFGVTMNNLNGAGLTSPSVFALLGMIMLALRM